MKTIRIFSLLVFSISTWLFGAQSSHAEIQSLALTSCDTFWEAEPNNDMSNANLVCPSEYYDTSALFTPGDVDYFRLDNWYDGTDYTISVINSGHKPAEFTVMDADGNPVKGTYTVDSVFDYISTYSFYGLSNGSYYIKVTNAGSPDVPDEYYKLRIQQKLHSKVPIPPITKKYQRFGGADRFEVNKQLTGQIEDHSLDYVILADALNYPDALSSGVLNGSLNSATLLTTDNQTVIENNITEAKRLLKPSGKILIVGGTASVSANVENAFKNDFPVERIGGKDRIAVSTAIAERVNQNPSEIFLTYGLVFSDALSIVPYATIANIPIILQYGVGLNSEVSSYIQQHPTIKKVTIVSGTGVIPVSVETQLKSLGVTTVERVAGQNRYDTSLLIAQKYFPDCTSVALANGYVFADALSGNQFAYKNSMPIILVESNNATSDTITFVKNHSNQNLFLYGGPATIDKNIVRLFQ